MKRFFAVALCLVVMLSMCACAPEFIETPDGATVPPVENVEIFTYESDEWVITKIDMAVSRGSSGFTNYHYVITMQTEEYACGVTVNYEEYVLLNVGDVISARYFEKYDSAYINPIGSIEFDGKTFSANCYKR